MTVCSESNNQVTATALLPVSHESPCRGDDKTSTAAGDRTTAHPCAPSGGNQSESQECRKARARKSRGVVQALGQQPLPLAQAHWRWLGPAASLCALRSGLPSAAQVLLPVLQRPPLLPLGTRGACPALRPRAASPALPSGGPSSLPLSRPAHRSPRLWDGFASGHRKVSKGESGKSSPPGKPRAVRERGRVTVLCWELRCDTCTDTVMQTLSSSGKKGQVGPTKGREVAEDSCVRRMGRGTTPQAPLTSPGQQGTPHAEHGSHPNHRALFRFPEGSMTLIRLCVQEVCLTNSTAKCC